jgi:hypothetical protein
MLRITTGNVIIRGRTTFCCFLVTRKRDEAGLCNVAKGWAGFCIIIIKKPRNLAKVSDEGKIDAVTDRLPSLGAHFATCRELSLAFFVNRALAAPFISIATLSSVPADALCAGLIRATSFDTRPRS